MFDTQTMTSSEIEQSGYEYGTELAAALVLASHRVETDLETKRQMAQLVLREISASVDALRATRTPLVLVSAYEQACREGVRKELERSFATHAYEPVRHAA
jgi:hypothetical protein